MRVAVLGGGRSEEHEVSRRSAASVAGGLREAGHDVVEVRLHRDGRWSTADGAPVSLEPAGGLLGADVAFPVLHGPYGEDGTVQGLLELLDVPYVGSGVLASAACMDKLVFKDLMAAAGVAQVGYAGVDARQWAEDREGALARLAALGVPCWVKPARLGSSVGIVPVRRPEELATAVEVALRHDPRVIVEAGATGLEVETAVLGPTEAPEVSVAGEIVLADTAPGAWYDYEAKYTPGGMSLQVPARIPEELADELRTVARHAFAAAGCHGLARADFFVDVERSVVLLNELNTLPGFTETSVYGALWEASGVPYPELCSRLCELAVARRAAEHPG